MFEGDHKDRGPFVGMEVLAQYPFNKLPDIRANVDWSNRGVSGWGEISIPSISNSDAQQGVFGQDDVIEYINGFKNKFGEEPIFTIHPNGAWYEKIKITNPSFLTWKAEGDKAKQA